MGKEIDVKRNYIYNTMLKNKEEGLNQSFLFFIHNNDIAHSVNKNGIFFNLSHLEDKHINGIYEFITQNTSSDCDSSSDDYSSEEVDIDHNDSFIVDMSIREKDLLKYTQMI